MNVNAPRLKSIVERIERMEEERKAIAGDIRDIYSEAKGVGYDVKTLRKVVAARKMDAADREEQETLFETYMRALGHNVERAVRAVHAGEMSIREAEEATGVKRSTIHRAVPKEGRRAKFETAPHDATTGEIIETPGVTGPGAAGQALGEGQPTTEPTGSPAATLSENAASQTVTADFDPAAGIHGEDGPAPNILTDDEAVAKMMAAAQRLAEMKRAKGLAV